ncbi:thioredoxin domain-containing protein [Clostridium lundense]|uniref:thioredoxin domain-containing protein n=1 Tax=Clostridium lundense TaxID=319475 RepID=UPI00047F1CB4|nr:thioredoxin domain-containing protein [Clostridium lundense]
MSDENIHKYENRLVNEKSPYLLQHAHNPVDWYPWSEEAFAKAKEENKPIFLSIGYSTCHWCHVMERESFEDEEVGKKLNEGFVSIKVDREERPDVDSIYMTFCQATTGSGGWPLTIIMTPDKKPFFAGTYFPKKNSFGRPGLLHILDAISEEWRDNKDKLINSSERLMEDINNYIVGDKSEELEEEVIERAYENLNEIYDPVYGGFYTQPKFPTPHKLMFLLRFYKVYNNKRALEMVENTLHQMYKGGIFDHIGFGFSRYSTDKKWFLPHFEKMLYDNALLTLVYAETYQVTKDSFYKEIGEKILNYILRDMTSPKGGFYSAEDADSEGEEGKFYLWDLEEIYEVLGEEQGKIFSSTYGISKQGNFEGKNIPNLIGKDLKKIDENSKKELDSYRDKLFKYREKRIHPFKDDKILTSWNSLAIVAFAYAGRAFNNDEYTKAGEKALKFVLDNLLREDGRLLARYREGEGAHLAYLDDYAFLIWALIELYESTFNVQYLDKAIYFNKEMVRLFWDETSAGFFLYGKDGEQLIYKPKESYDSAIPSGNSVAVYNMLRLSRITGDIELGEMASNTFNNFGGNIKNNLESHGFLLTAFMYSIKENTQIVIAGDPQDNITREMLKELNDRFLPFTNILLNSDGNNLNKLVPFVEHEGKINEKTTAYLCENFSCNKPVDNIMDFVELLDR